jgi:hypothetical protein
MRDHKSGFKAGPVGSDSMSGRKPQYLYCCQLPIRDLAQQLLFRLLHRNPVDIVSGAPLAVSGVASFPVIRSRVSAEGFERSPIRGRRCPRISIAKILRAAPRLSAIWSCIGLATLRLTTCSTESGLLFSLVCFGACVPSLDLHEVLSRHTSARRFSSRRRENRLRQRQEVGTVGQEAITTDEQGSGRCQVRYGGVKDGNSSFCRLSAQSLSAIFAHQLSLSQDVPLHGVA